MCVVGERVYAHRALFTLMTVGLHVMPMALRDSMNDRNVFRSPDVRTSLTLRYADLLVAGFANPVERSTGRRGTGHVVG